MYRVNFVNVGRNKTNWSIELQDAVAFDEGVLVREVKKKGALMSNGIDILVENGSGTVYAGFRPVGEITFEKLEG